MKNSGLFLNMAKWCFGGGLFFEVLILIKRFVFGVSGIVSKVFKMLVFFPVFGFFLGWLIVVHLGLEGLGVFVFLVFVFLFCVALVSVLFALFLVLWLDAAVLFFLLFFLVVFFGFGGFLILFVFVFLLIFLCFVFVFVFFGGFKGQVRWPKGPPHLALNPPYFICFCFFFFFVSLCLLLLEKKTLFSPLKRAFLRIFSVSPFVSL